jgi:tetratricopeptide (TPR) repeat protein
VGPSDELSTASDRDGREADAWLEAAKQAERRGELLAAFDLADRGLAEHPDDTALKHRAVLALARAGATRQAATRFAEYRLDRVPDEDVAALRARIAKDAALSEKGSPQPLRAAHAAKLYADVFARTGGYYPAINAATLWLIAGQRSRSVELAKEVLGLLDDGDEASYYEAATEAEAQLLLGRLDATGAALERAAERHGGDYGALATTRRQLRVICEILGVDQAVLTPLAGPGVVYFCGHRIGRAGEPSRFPSEAEGRVTEAIARVVDRDRAGFAYGALSGGADIMWAEALLARGTELHVVLPFDEREFVEFSVAPCGDGWVERFDRCLARATEIRRATARTLEPDDVLYAYGGELAMGLALLRASYLDAEVWQLALWDGEPAAGSAGTAIDVATWTAAGRSVTAVTPQGEITNVGEGAGTRRTHSERADAPTAAGTVQGTDSERVVRAMLFGDFSRFSELTDEQAVTFARLILGAVADVLRRYEDCVRWRNTWGDGLTVMLSDVPSAAGCALALQDAVAALDLQSHGLPTHLALRLGGHVGPVFAVYDPVLGVNAFTGTHVSRTARIEPVTPPGEVYVTEAFAAALVLAGSQEFACDYVGHMAAAKGYGRLRMYRLRRNTWGDDPSP